MTTCLVTKIQVETLAEQTILTRRMTKMLLGPEISAQVPGRARHRARDP
jgi:hypothetical protein